MVPGGACYNWGITFWPKWLRLMLGMGTTDCMNCTGTEHRWNHVRPSVRIVQYPRGCYTYMPFFSGWKQVCSPFRSKTLRTHPSASHRWLISYTYPYLHARTPHVYPHARTFPPSIYLCAIIAREKGGQRRWEDSSGRSLAGHIEHVQPCFRRPRGRNAYFFGRGGHHPAPWRGTYYVCICMHVSYAQCACTMASHAGQTRKDRLYRAERITHYIQQYVVAEDTYWNKKLNFWLRLGFLFEREILPFTIADPDFLIFV